MKSGHRGLCGSVFKYLDSTAKFEGAAVVRLNQDVISLETPEENRSAGQLISGNSAWMRTDP